eukprot:CAMPEP_0117436064 /NCGR_PEP_ID=MMETSP0759-20121206/815_1 /TAXON_ID=63605 /ORGANISM="Percolomonas cosmopolitus, Strain WS" /LENGTH=595 /DNA_ID=CAMNT_0005227653 /DNA_START=21 /DNA_END=1806 /DNA_ORIENTATION=-
MVTTPNYKLQRGSQDGRDESESKYDYDDDLGEEHTPMQYEFVPAAGRHILQWKGYYIYMHIAQIGEQISAGWEKEAFQLETIDLYAFGGQGAYQALFELIQESIKEQLQKYREKVKIYVLGRWSGWTFAMAKERRPLDSVILPNDLLPDILADINKFLARSEWYQDHGVPFRRGYLFYGVHGTGKTSLITAIAAAIGYDIAVLNLSSGNLDDRELNDRIHSAPPRSIILLEDIDAIFVDRDTPQEKEKRGREVSFSGFLNALDGAAAATEGRLFFMTTNHIEKLDAALLRAGRCDVKIAFTRATKDQLGRCFERFFPNAAKEDKARFVREFPDNSVTMAQIQSHLLQHKDSAERAVEEAKTFVEKLTHAASESGKVSKILPLRQWLKRLSLYQYYDLFREKRFLSPLDFKEVRENELRSMGLKNIGEQKLLESSDEFALATRAQIERFYRDLFGSDVVSEQKAREFAQSIPESSVSLTQIRVYLSKKKYGERGLRMATHQEVMRDVEQLLNPVSNVVKRDTVLEPAVVYVRRMAEEGRLLPIDLECVVEEKEKIEGKEDEMETTKDSTPCTHTISIYDKFEAELVCNTKHVAHLE